MYDVTSHSPPPTLIFQNDIDWIVTWGDYLVANNTGLLFNRRVYPKLALIIKVSNGVCIKIERILPSGGSSGNTYFTSGEATQRTAYGGLHGQLNVWVPYHFRLTVRGNNGKLYYFDRYNKIYLVDPK